MVGEGIDSLIVQQWGEKRDGAQFAKKQAKQTILTRKIEIEYKHNKKTAA